MSCVKGKSICEICGVEFEWRRHDSQNPASTCGKSCKNIQNSKRMKERNELQFKYKNATDQEKFQRFKDNFEEKVIRKDGCWAWKGFVDKNGYSQLTGYNGKTTVPLKAHRISYQIYKGNIPKGMFVCHTCDNPICTNPDHLWIGSKKDNDEDRDLKGRGSIGEKRPLAKLKDEDIREIRKKLSLGISGVRLAKDYGVTDMVISKIKNGKTWKHVKE